MALSDRKKRILRAIVETYIATAEPVGSKAVAQLAGLDVSTATIRNEMADLTDQGYLEQPHTSAGRIPSAAGYRLYVNELMDRQQLTLQETQRINDALNLKMEELDRCLDRAGKVLSQISDYPVFTMAAAKERITVKRFDLLMVEENAFIAVVMTDNSVVKNKLVHIPDGLSDPQLQMLSAVLNSSFVGLSREEMEEALDKMETRTAPGAFELIALVVEFAMEVLADQGQQKFRTAGITHLLEHPEYRSLDKAKPLMAYLSEESDVPRLPATLDRAGERKRRAKGHQRGDGQLRHRRQHAGRDRGGWPHPHGLRQGDSPAVLLRRQPDSDVRQRAARPGGGFGGVKFRTLHEASLRCPACRDAS